MHPQIKLPKPGKCPICFMDLIPLTSDGGAQAGPRQLFVSENAAKLMEIETASVERKAVSAAIRMVGLVDYDETRVAHIAAWVPGRIDRLFVDYTGVTVKKGDPLVLLYSPELFSSQTELLQAMRSASEKTLAAAREKLRLLGLTEEQVAGIESRGTAEERVTIFAPAGGVVVSKEARDGMYVMTGERIYTIADLSEVWVQLDAYESDIASLRPGQPVEFTAEALPGEVFSGTVAFIDPVLTQNTRTVKVRLNAPNGEQKLKPGMFVRAAVEVSAAADGVVPLVIPASAPLVTGKRAVVYVAVDGSSGLFEGRNVVLGPRAGDYYVVKSGVREGEMVVTRGNFKIDSSLQIQGKPSMMTLDPEPVDGAVKSQSVCPVMGGEIDKAIYTDYQGQRIYFCCPGCIDTFLGDPEKYLEMMRGDGVEPERVEESHE